MKAQAQAKLYEAAMGPIAAERQLRAAAPKCRSCHAPIRWVTTTAGKHMPVDYDPHEAGNVLVTADGRSRACEPGGPVDGVPVDTTLHFSHFATCPSADHHRSTR